MPFMIDLTWLFVPPDVEVIVQPVVVYPGHHIEDKGFRRSMHLSCIARFRRLVSKVPFIHFPVQSRKMADIAFKRMNYNHFKSFCKE